MAQYAFDFTTIADLSDFTFFGVRGSDLAIEDGLQALRVKEDFTGTGVVAVTAAGSTHLFADIIVLVRRSYTDQNNDRTAGPVIRATGVISADTTGYVLGSRANTGLQAVEMTGGLGRVNLSNVTGAVSAAVWQWQRMQLVNEGGINYIRGKSWTGDIVADQPAGWLLEYSSASNLTVNNAGAVGIGSLIQSNGRFTYFRELRIGTDGDAAPTGPVGPGPSGRRRSPLLLTPW